MIPWLALVNRMVFVFAVVTALACSSARAQQQPRFTEIQRDGRISWTSETNVSYKLQKTVQLGSGLWSDVVTVPGNGGTVSAVDFAQTNAQAFYRVVATNNLPCTNGGGVTCIRAVSLGLLNGDMDGCRAGPLATGCGDAWFRITVREGNGSQTVDLRLDVALDSSAGANYDLYLRDACGGQALRFSTLGPGMRDALFYTITDIDGTNNSDEFWIEVRRATGSPAGSWTLRTSGGTGPCH